MVSVRKISDPFEIASMMTFVPAPFIPSIGLVMISHAFMDQKLQQVISHLAHVDFSGITAILSKVPGTNVRVEIYKNLARVTESNVIKRKKMLVLGNVINGLSKERNIIAHNLPSFVSPANESIGYFKDVNKTKPQLQISPPYLATIESLSDLSNRILTAGSWLGMLLPFWADDDASDPFANAHAHPDWDIEEKFPWRDRVKSEE